jgi:hypothetical protein
MVDVLQRQVQLASAGHCRGSSGAVAVYFEDDHYHQWDRLPDSVGLFACRERGCLWYAVCPGCLGSLEVTLGVCDGVEGLSLYWCPCHQGGGAYAGVS